MKHRKIAFYIGSLDKGGAERVITNLAEYFFSKGYEVTMVTKMKEKEEYSLSAGITRIIADITKEEERGRIRNLFLRIRKLRRIIKEIHPDVVVSFIGKNNLMSIAATRGLGIPVVVSVRSNPSREIGCGVKLLLTLALFHVAEGIVLQTTEAKQYFPKEIQKKAVVLQNSLNPAFIRAPYEKERRKEIVSVGRIDDNKNTQHNDRVDRIFEKKFIELNGLSLRKAFGFTEKDFKRCIPKQFIWFDKNSLDKKLFVSSIDAS